MCTCQAIEIVNIDVISRIYTIHAFMVIFLCVRFKITTERLHWVVVLAFQLIHRFMKCTTSKVLRIKESFELFLGRLFVDTIPCKMSFILFFLIR